MKHTDLLEAMGGIDSRYLEDAADPAGRTGRILRSMMRPAAAVAAVGILSVTAFSVWSVVREGIEQNTQPAYSESSAAASLTAVTAQTEQPEGSAQPEETTALNEAETEATETVPLEEQLSVLPPVPDPGEYVTDLPEMPELPAHNFHPATGQTFRTNGICKSGTLLITVGELQIYDNMNDTGLTFADMTQEYQHGEDSFDPNTRMFQFDSVTGEITSSDPTFSAGACFVKLQVTVQNIDGISGMTSLNPDWENGNNVIYPQNFAGDYDFNVSNLCFGFLPDADNLTAETTNVSYMMRPCYYSLSGIFPRPSNAYTLWADGQWFHLEPQQEITFEIGAFLPTIATDRIERQYGIPEGESMLPFYAFFAGSGRANPYVEFHLDGE